MAGKQAKIVGDAELPRLKAACDDTRYPERNWLIVMLSYKAGLRAVEIAKLQRYMLLDARGELDNRIHLENRICKKGSGRIVPMPRGGALWEAVLAYFRACPGSRMDPLILSERAGTEEWASTHDSLRAMTRQSVVYIFWKMYRKAGLQGCSSHSGRRTFGTKAARQVVTVGGSLRDVQYLLGHKSLNVTQRYVEIDEEVHDRLARLL